MRMLIGSLRRNCRGQATVEAAFTLPLAVVLVLMLVQPGIVLYDRLVMRAAAAEGCRLLATASAENGVTADVCEDYLRRRLGAIPQVDCFHVHGTDCSWHFTLEGDEDSSEVRVEISGKFRPLPLIGWSAGFLGFADDEGLIELRVSESMPSQPAWAHASGSAASWVGAWLS